MPIKHISRIAGSVHYIDALESLPDDDCNILFVSSRTLYLLANIATLDINFDGRYAKSALPGGYIDVVGPYDIDQLFVDQVANKFRLEVQPVTCEITTVLEGILDVLRQIAVKPACCNDATGTQLPEDPVTEVPPIGPGTDFPTGEDYNLYKCLAAESIVYGIFSSQALIIQQYPFGWTNITVAAMNAVVIYALQATKLGAIALTLGAVADIVAIIIDLTVADVIRVREELLALNDQLKCALYCAADTMAAIAAYRDVLESSEVLLPSDISYLELYLLPVAFNRLFEYRPDEVEFLFSGDCSQCGCGDFACSFVFVEVGDPAVQVGTGAFDYTGVPFELSSIELSAGVHAINFTVPDLCTICSPPANWCIKFTSTTITTGLSANWTRELYSANCPGPTLTESDFTDQFPNLNEVYAVAAGAFSNPDPFTITCIITGSIAGTSSSPAAAEGCPE